VPEIKRKEYFVLHGEEFSSLRKVHTDVENRLGAVIDTFDVTLTPAQKLKIMAGMVHNKNAIKDLLSVDVDMNTNPNDIQVDLHNILDIAGRI
jgi:hypothetical protein